MHYVPALDGIRAVAVLLVFAFHARVPGFQGGFLGVDLFFVLSGYLITRLLAEEHRQSGSIAIGQFYLRRLRRLYPALLLLICVYLLCASTLFRDQANHVRDALVAIFYFADYGRAFWRVPEVLQHTWSLSVEEHFYLLWAPLLLAILKFNQRYRLFVLAVLFAIATEWRVAVLYTSNDWLQTHYRFDTRLSGLLIGAFIGIWRPEFKTRGWIGAAGSLLFGCCVYVASWRSDASLLCGALAADLAAALIVIGADRLPVLACRPLPWLGRMSYGIYLWHYPMVYWMRNHGIHWTVTFAVAGIGATACAALSHYFVERRFYLRRLQSADRAEIAGGD